MIENSPDIADWNQCASQIYNVEIDANRIESLIEKSSLRLEFIKKIAVDTKTVHFIVEDYYEAIKELLTAYLLNNGLKSRNQKCLISYFYKQNPSHEKEAYLIAQMLYFRNGLHYYGSDVPIDFYKTNKGDFEKIIKLLNELIKNGK